MGGQLSQPFLSRSGESMLRYASKHARGEASARLMAAQWLRQLGEVNCNPRAMLTVIETNMMLPS
jgi:hypothetical protein